MKVDLVIRNAHVIDHDGEMEGGVAVLNGKIAFTGANDALPDAKRVIDAQGRVLMPGVIDPHCHLGNTYPYNEDMRTESAAAASGGITTIMMYVRNKGVSYLPVYQERKTVGEQNSLIDFGLHFAIQREEHIHEIPSIVEKTGVRSYKCYFGYEPDNPIGIVPATDGWVYATMRHLAKVRDGVISVHCENTAIASWLKEELKATGRQDLGAYTESRPAFCEEETIKRMIFLAERTKCPLHLVHTSVGMGPVLAAEARARGIDVTVETCQHYLTRTCYDPDLDMKAKISPPLRDKNELEGLWRGMMNGSVFSLGSDHVPFLPKKGEDIWRELSGIVNFPWELALMLHFGVHQRKLPLSRLVELTSYNPARRFGLWPNKGTLRPGADADLTLIDLEEERTVQHTGHGTCIYEGWKLKGWPVTTISRGAVVCENGMIDDTAYGHGRYVGWQ
ncbi:MAG: allantoinase [Alphaproteobacteria bacterium]|jgi:allantoinase|nr:allantoinase [Alphaproteobacteria bacterium]